MVSIAVYYLIILDICLDIGSRAMFVSLNVYIVIESASLPEGINLTQLPTTPEF